MKIRIATLLLAVCLVTAHAAAQAVITACTKCKMTAKNFCVTPGGGFQYPPVGRTIYEAECELIPPSDTTTTGMTGCYVLITEVGPCDHPTEDYIYFSDQECAYSASSTACMNEQVIVSPQDDPETPDCEHTPLVFCGKGGDCKFSGPDGNRFDLDADGVPDATGWPLPGTVFLALDRNGNDTIDNGRELFGNATFKGVLNGFFALASFDLNDNFQIDPFDQVWNDLLLWDDLNHDRVSQPHELTRVKDSGITGLGLDYTRLGRRDQHWNTLRLKATVWYDGHVSPYYDAYLTTSTAR